MTQKNAYEIRLEILKMAEEIENSNRYSIIEKLQADQGNDIPVNDWPSELTTGEIIKTAEALYKFVEDK